MLFAGVAKKQIQQNGRLVSPHARSFAGDLL